MDKVGKADMKVAQGRGEIVPRDFAAAVKDIKLAILQSRARAAHASNVEALKLYFYVGGYVSKKTRTAKWGSGAIDALSNRLQVELPGLRGFSASNIKSMRIFYEAWKHPGICPGVVPIYIFSGAEKPSRSQQVSRTRWVSRIRAM